MAHTALQVANRLIELGNSKGLSFTPMQVLKLVYIAHGWMLAIYNRPLVVEPIKAWMYGPVIPQLYDKIKHFGSNPVSNINCIQSTNLGAEECNILEYVVRAYGDIDGITLSQITHAPYTPWSITYDQANWGDTISNDLISHHYKGLLSQMKTKASVVN